MGDKHSKDFEAHEEGSIVAERYRIESLVATGGMGLIYKAIQQPLNRPVALKVMRTDLMQGDTASRRFFREAVSVSQLTHPNTITLFDYGESDGELFIAMEWLEGVDLGKMLRGGTRLPPNKVVKLAIQISMSLAEAHRKGIVHRDLKPENIFITKNYDDVEVVKVLDFGIAKVYEESPSNPITRVGFVCGTPEFMSPEQSMGHKVDGRSDLYSLGCLMFRMLSGVLPYKGKTALVTVMQHQADPTPILPSTIPQNLAQIVYKTMEKDARDRFETAEMLVEALTKWQKQRGDTETDPEKNQDHARVVHEQEKLEDYNDNWEDDFNEDATVVELSPLTKKLPFETTVDLNGTFDSDEFADEPTVISMSAIPSSDEFPLDTSEDSELTTYPDSLVKPPFNDTEHPESGIIELAPPESEPEEDNVANTIEEINQALIETSTLPATQARNPLWIIIGVILSLLLLFGFLLIWLK